MSCLKIIKNKLSHLSPCMHLLELVWKNRSPICAQPAHVVISTLRFLVVCLSVCVCVTDVGVAATNLRFVCKTITCVSAFTEMAIIFLEIVKAAAGLDTLRCRPATRRMPLWALAIALATGKNTKLFGVLDQNENRFFTYESQRAGSKAATVVTSN